MLTMANCMHHYLTKVLCTQNLLLKVHLQVFSAQVGTYARQPEMRRVHFSISGGACIYQLGMQVYVDAPCNASRPQQLFRSIRNTSGQTSFHFAHLQVASSAFLSVHENGAAYMQARWCNRKGSSRDVQWLYIVTHYSRSIRYTWLRSLVGSHLCHHHDCWSAC